MEQRRAGGMARQTAIVREDRVGGVRVSSVRTPLQGVEGVMAMPTLRPDRLG